MLSLLNKGISDQQKKRIRRKKQDFHLANVDLELESPVSLLPMLDELGEQVGALWAGGVPEFSDGKKAGLEIGDYFKDGVWIDESYDDEKDLVGGVDVLISAFCDLVENLSAKSRNIWDGCQKKVFDIGFECGNTERVFMTAIRPETLRRCADIGASISLTVYPYVNYELQMKS